MHRFTDACGREHQIDVDLDVLDAIKAATDIDFVELRPSDDKAEAASAEEVVHKLNRDVRTLVKCVHIATGEKQELAEFRKGMKGQAIDDGLRAFLEGVIDFFPNRLASVLRKAQQRFDSQEAMVLQAMELAIADGALDAEVIQIPDELRPYFDQIASTSITLPAASELTPAN